MSSRLTGEKKNTVDSEHSLSIPEYSNGNVAKHFCCGAANIFSSRRATQSAAAFTAKYFAARMLPMSTDIVSLSVSICENGKLYGPNHEIQCVALTNADAAKNHEIIFAHNQAQLCVM